MAVVPAVAGGPVPAGGGSGRIELPRGPWLKGYARTLSGEILEYHSPFPDVTTALIVRATDGTMSAAWETEPVPPDLQDPEVTFIWMAGLATKDGAHRFTLEAEGKPLLDFRTAKDDSERTWEVAGVRGAVLRFETTMLDSFRELFGFMFLTLPRDLLAPGRPVRLRVTGENAGSCDWCLVFPHPLASWLRAGAEQALVREESRLKGLLRVEVSHIAPPAEAMVSVARGAGRRIDLKTGYNLIQVPIDPVDHPTEIEIRLDLGRGAARTTTAVAVPVSRRELWLLPHSHNDIGFSDRQDIVERNQWAFFEEAIEIARRTADEPEGARFKWNSEVLWAVDSYLRQASPEKKAVFLDAVRRGWIGLQGLYANLLTGMAVPEELFRFTAFARAFSRAHGLRIDTVMTTDIPGATWSLVPALAQSGIRYFSSGPNYMPNLPDGGDRIGFALKAWADRPFYWIGPSGKDKILFWMAGRGYSWFHGLNLGDLSMEKAGPVLDYCRELAQKGYPYDLVQVRYTIGGDNGPPDPRLSDFVKTWNERYESPKFVIASASDLFVELERRHAALIPSVRGDFSPYWEDGAASTAREQAMNRAAANRLLQAEALFAMAGPSRFPAEAFAEAWRFVVLWDEHTWGAHDSVSDPDGDGARSQWVLKRRLVEEADRRSGGLLAKAVELWGSEGESGAFDVVNATGLGRSEVVFLTGEMSARGDLVRDAGGSPVPSQRLRDGRLAVLAGPIPPFSARRYSVEPGPAAPPGSGRGVVPGVDGPSLENETFKAALDPRTGAVRSLIWNARPGLELVDATSGYGLNEYLYVPGRDPGGVRGVEAASIRAGETGPLVASLVVESSAPGARSLRREYRLTAGSDRLEIVDGIDKEMVRDKESVHFAFPFDVPGGRVRLDLGWALIRPDADQIAGACRDYFCLQTAADVSNEDWGLTWASLDAPLVEIGEMTDERPVARGVRGWRTEAGNSRTLFSYVMNNYWHTNYKADQEGPATFRFVLRPHEGSDASDTTRLGIETSRPLLVLPASPSAPDEESLLGLESGAVIIVSLRPGEDGRTWLARLYNASETPGAARFLGRLAAGTEIFMSSPDEIRGERIEGMSLDLQPFETAAIRIERPADFRKP